MEQRVYVLQVSEQNGPWEPMVFANKNDAIEKGVNILTEWFPDEWTELRAETAKQTLKNTHGFVFVSETGMTVRLEIFARGLQ